MIIRSCSATRNQDRRSFHSGLGTATVMQAGEIGRWVAVNTASSSAAAFCAKAGEGCVGQIDQAVIVRHELGRLGMRLAAVEHVRDCLALSWGQRGHVDE